MSGTGEAAAPAVDARAAWLAARAAVRGRVQELLGSAELAHEMLPVAAGEPNAPRAPLAAALRRAADFVALAAWYPELLHGGLRKQTGAWFTPAALAAPTTMRTLAPLLANGARPAELRIVDPAVGGGTFLLAALQQLVAAGAPPRTAARCLSGRDVDATAAALAALAIWHTSGGDERDLRAIAANVRAGDGLLDLEDGTFDAVLTNPPWETLQGTPGAAVQGAALRGRFVHQGAGKLYTYRLFVERAHRLLRDGGRFGLVVPASLWFDRDAEPLRRLLLDRCEWDWLFGFENRRRVFAIDGRYRFGIVVGTRGGSTRAVRVAFGRVDVADWAAPSPAHVRCTPHDIAAASPASGAFVEVEDERDLRVLRTFAAHGTPLLGPRAALVWRQGDFNLTSHRRHFVPRAAAEHDGWQAGRDGVWRRPGAGDLLPLWQGAMVWDLHPAAAAHARGTGHATAWGPPAADGVPRPAYLVDAAAWRARAAERSPARLVLRALSNATNERTAAACLLPDVPCGNSLGVFAPRGGCAAPLRTLAATAAVLGSLPFDHALRLRLSGTNLNAFVLADCVVPLLDDAAAGSLAVLALRVSAVLPLHAPLWSVARAEGWLPAGAEPAADPERAALFTTIDVQVGTAYGLSRDDVAWIVRGCDLPAEALRARTPPPECHARGFWRVDRTLPPAQRRPNRWLAAL